MKKGSNIKACAFVNIKMKKTGKFVDDQNIMIKKKNRRPTKISEKPSFADLMLNLVHSC